MSKAKANGVPPDKQQLPPVTGGRLMDKVEVYGWEMVDKPGKYMRLSKHLLHVDHDYQRDAIRHARVNRIAGEWSWVSLGCLSVARRPDGSYWVFDGQHRKLAADKRSDVDELPCMVFESSGPAKESRYFLVANGDRGSVTMLDKFKALVAQHDATAIAVRDMIEASRYKIQQGGTKNTVRCVGVLYRAMQADPDATRRAWSVAVSVSERETINDRVMHGLYVLERHLNKLGLPSLVDPKMRPFIDRLSPKAILKSVAQTAEFYAKGGPKICAEGVLRLLNRGRRNPVPSLYADDLEARSATGEDRTDSDE